MDRKPATTRTSHKNYFTTGYQSCGVKFDAGTCIEVIEHLTPTMLRDVFVDVAAVSNPGAVYLLNSGLAQFTKMEDNGYIDPFVRGHIISWTVEGLRQVLHDLGFCVFPIRGKTWAVLIEYQSQSKETEDVTDRIWSALPENLEHLKSQRMGSVMKILGLESVRAYL